MCCEFLCEEAILVVSFYNSSRSVLDVMVVVITNVLVRELKKISTLCLSVARTTHTRLKAYSTTVCILTITVCFMIFTFISRALSLLATLYCYYDIVIYSQYQ